MSFNPDLPANNSPNSSAEMRDQLNGLDDKIEARVTQHSLDEAISTLTAGNVDTVPDLDITFSDPPSKVEMEAFLANYKLLVQRMKRG